MRIYKALKKQQSLVTVISKTGASSVTGETQTACSDGN